MRLRIWNESKRRVLNTVTLLGQMVATQKTESINIESLAKGIYILNIRNGNAIKNYKIAIL